MVAALLVLNRGDGKNYFGMNLRKRRRRLLKSRTWAVLERDGSGYWRAVRFQDFKPEDVEDGQRVMREYK